MSGEFDIHSLEFYKIMAQAKADLDKNGDVDTDEEQSIFNDYMARFERDGQAGITNEDVFIYRGEVTNTDEDRAKEQRLMELNEHYDKLSIQDRIECVNLKRWYIDKVNNMDDFRSDAWNAIEYLYELAEKREQEHQALTGNENAVDLYSVDKKYQASLFIESYNKYYPPKDSTEAE
ncbi:hypothetical protein J6S88_04280 [bacterium]|nr:hypothetical protein [bacterium]